MSLFSPYSFLIFELGVGFGPGVSCLHTTRSRDRGSFFSRTSNAMSFVAFHHNIFSESISISISIGIGLGMGYGETLGRQHEASFERDARWMGR